MELDRAVAATEPSARWPGRIRELAAQWRLPMDARAKEAVLAELWKLLNLALHRYVRIQAQRFGRLDAADAADIAADKALELLGRLDCRQWDPQAGSDAQVCGFLAAVARNGVVDLARRRGREVLAPAASSWTCAERVSPVDRRIAADVELSMDGARYARAIVACAARLTARARRAWLLRVFSGLSSAQIARHPEILTSRGGVDLILNRSRRQLRKCMKSKGLEPHRMPPGTVAALWEMISTEGEEPAGRPAGDHPI